MPIHFSKVQLLYTDISKLIISAVYEHQ